MIRVLDIGDSWDEKFVAAAFFKTLQKYQTDMAEEIMYDIMKNLYSLESVPKKDVGDALYWWRQNQESIEEELYYDEEKEGLK